MNTIEILVTRDYNLFKVLNGNRNVREKHVQELMLSMSEEACISPIQVNERMEVIDGQHRLEALKRNKKPVHYYIVKGSNIQTVQRLNTHTLNWKVEDYMKSYIADSKKDYKMYQKFIASYPFSHKVCVMLLTGTAYTSTDELKKFTTGEFKIKDIEKATDIGSKITRVKEFYAGWRKTNWIEALTKCLAFPKFDFEHFMHKLQRQQRVLVDCATIDQYIDVIEEIYNDHSRPGSRVDLKSLKKKK